jgi:hypothetical protein
MPRKVLAILLAALALAILASPALAAKAAAGGRSGSTIIAN